MSKETTIAGVLAFASALLSAISKQIDNDPATVADWATVVTMAFVLLGMWRARDNNKSSEDVGLK